MSADYADRAVGRGGGRVELNARRMSVSRGAQGPQRVDVCRMRWHGQRPVVDSLLTVTRCARTLRDGGRDPNFGQSFETRTPLRKRGGDTPFGLFIPTKTLAKIVVADQRFASQERHSRHGQGAVTISLRTSACTSASCPTSKWPPLSKRTNFAPAMRLAVYCAAA